jgi:hypothetical protein
VHAEEAELGQALGYLTGELATLEPLPHAGQDLASNERPNGIADVPLLVGEQAVDRQEVERIDLGGGHRAPSLTSVEHHPFLGPAVDTARHCSSVGLESAIGPPRQKGVVMRYLLLIFNEETGQMEGASPEQQAAEMQKWDDYGNWLTDKGWIRGGDALQPSAQATTVRVRKGETLTTDGPFAETKEQLGGYYEVECQNLDQAIEAASRIPSVGTGSIEVRPIMEFDTPHK